MTDNPTGLLHGVRFIESALLGPGSITTHLADMGAEVIKVEPPQGDYIRRMTWPIINHNSLLHLHIHRGKRSIAIDLRTPQGAEPHRLPKAERRGDLQGSRSRRRRGRRGDAAGRARQAWARLRRSEAGE